MLDTSTNFFKEINQRLALNSQYSTWTNVEARVPQGTILGPLIFLIYVNDLPENLVSNPKLFANDTSLFSVTRNKNLSLQNLISRICSIQLSISYYRRYKRDV